MPHPLPPRRGTDLALALLVLLVGALLHLQLATRPAGSWTTGRLNDTDAYARTLRVEQLRATGDWFGTTLPGLGAPEGLSLHWTRPLDLLILAPAMAAARATGADPARAIFWTGAAISPLLHLLCALAAAWAARALVPGPAAWAASAAILLNPLLLFAYGAFGQTDHHMLVLLAAILATGASLRAMRAERPGPALLAGLALGCGIWVSPEVLLAAVPLLAAQGLAWCLGAPAAARQGLRSAAAMAATLALAVAAEHPPARWLATEYDKVSAHHLAIALLAAAVFAVLAALPDRLPRAARLAAALAAGAAAAATLLALYPDALRSSEAAADPQAAALFLPHVAEMRPLRFRPADLHDLLLYAAGALPALVLLRLPLPVALAPALLLATTLAATLAHRRFAVDLAAASSLGAAVLLALALRAARLRWPKRLAAATAVLLPFAGLFFPAENPALREARACDWGRLGAWLAAADLPAATILTDSWRPTPELAWRTRHRFVVAPYHRGGPAFRDTVQAMQATDDAGARAILARRGATMVLLCTGHRPANLGPGNAAALEARLRAGTPPAWLEPVPLPSPLDPAFRLLRVR